MVRGYAREQTKNQKVRLATVGRVKEVERGSLMARDEPSASRNCQKAEGKGCKGK